MISLLHRSGYSINWVSSSLSYASHDNTQKSRRERVMNELLWRLAEHHFFILSSCTNKRNECGLHTLRHFISSFRSRSSFIFNDWDAYSLNLFLFIVFNIRSDHPWMYTVYANLCCLNRHLVHFCSFFMLSLLNIIMNRRKKIEKSIQHYYH